MGMGKGVVANFMSFSNNFFNQIRVFFQPVSGKEEGDLQIIFIQYFQYLLSSFCTPGAIKSNRNIIIITGYFIYWNQPLVKNRDYFTIFIPKIKTSCKNE